MQEYLILVAVLRTAAPQICKRKSGSDQGECLMRGEEQNREEGEMAPKKVERREKM